MERGGYVYILTNKNNTTLYTGVTAHLLARIDEHRSKKYSNSFTARYNLEKLVYYEGYHHIEEAIVREKQLKASNRQKKIQLVEAFNLHWQDLYEQLLEE